jgi:hypothetical protein
VDKLKEVYIILSNSVLKPLFRLLSFVKDHSGKVLWVRSSQPIYKGLPDQIAMGLMR